MRAMRGDRRTVEDLSLAELEQLVLTRRRDERLRRLREYGIEREVPETPPAPLAKGSLRLPRFSAKRTPRQARAPFSWKARLLTLVEVGALVGFLAIMWLWYQETQRTNLLAPQVPLLSEASESVSSPADAALLPGNPTPPAEEGAIPAIYREWIQPSSSGPVLPLGDVSTQRPVRIAIPKLGVDAPVVEGTDWEALKRGAGHVLGTANPGERGNLVISAHNDIFGELFRHLEELEPGDEFSVWDAKNVEHRYVIRTKRIVDPTEVSVMSDTPEPLATLITCHPYLIDSHRLIIQAELK